MENRYPQRERRRPSHLGGETYQPRGEEPERNEGQEPLDQALDRIIVEMAEDEQDPPDENPPDENPPQGEQQEEKNEEGDDATEAGINIFIQRLSDKLLPRLQTMVDTTVTAAIAAANAQATQGTAAPTAAPPIAAPPAGAQPPAAAPPAAAPPVAAPPVAAPTAAPTARTTQAPAPAAQAPAPAARAAAAPTAAAPAFGSFPGTAATATFGSHARTAFLPGFTPTTPYGQLLDPRTKEGEKHLARAREKLDYEFDGESDNLWELLEHIRVKATYMRCLPIFDVRTTSGATVSLLTHHGETTLWEVQNEANTKWKVNDWYRQARGLLGQSIRQSLTTKYSATMRTLSGEYTSGNGEIDGPTLWKVICDDVFPTNRRTTELLTSNLENLRPSQFPNSIRGYNQAFTLQKMRLAAARDGSAELTEAKLYNHVFRAYRTVEQDQFQGFLNTKEWTTPRLTHIQLMKEAMEWYTTYVEEGTWSQPSQNTQILALKATHAKDKAATQRQLAEIAKKISKTKKKTPQSTAKLPPASDRKHRAAGKLSPSKLKAIKADFEKWVLKKPKKGDEDKIVDHVDARGRMQKWNWCKYHQSMVRAHPNGEPHNSSTCFLKDLSPEDLKKAQEKFKAKNKQRGERVKVNDQVTALRAQLAAAEEKKAEMGSSSDEDSYDEEDFDSDAS